MKKIVLPACVVAAVSLLAVGTKLYVERTGRKVAELQERVSYMKEECVPMRFEIAWKRDSRMQVKVSMYDVMTGQKVGRSGSFELPGEELHVDFQVVRLSEGNFIFFPCGLYTDAMALAQSEKLYSLYDENGFPSIYGASIGGREDGTEIGQEDRVALGKEFSAYFARVKDGGDDGADGQYGTALHELRSISQFKSGFVYSVLCHPHTGGIDLRRDD